MPTRHIITLVVLLWTLAAPALAPLANAQATPHAHLHGGHAVHGGFSTAPDLPTDSGVPVAVTARGASSSARCARPGRRGSAQPFFTLLREPIASPISSIHPRSPNLVPHTTSSTAPRLTRAPPRD